MASTTDRLHLACPACGATNRVPAERLTEHPVCGKCKAPLFQGKPMELGETNFSARLAATDIPVVVDFWAPWCGPCRMMAPHFEAAAKQLEPEVRLAKLNTEEAQATAARLNIRSIPTLIMFRNGREVARQFGALDANALVRWVRGQL